MNQKSVSKNEPSNWSAMLLRPSIPSGSSSRRSMVRMCFSLSPNLGALTRCPSRNRRDFDEVFIVSFQSKISCVTVLLPSRVGIEENRSNVQRYLLSIIRPPRITYPSAAEPAASRLPPILADSSRIVMLCPGMSASRIRKAAAASEAMPPPTR